MKVNSAKVIVIFIGILVFSIMIADNMANGILISTFPLTCLISMMERIERAENHITEQGINYFTLALLTSAIALSLIGLDNEEIITFLPQWFFIALAGLNIFFIIKAVMIAVMFRKRKK